MTSTDPSVGTIDSTGAFTAKKNGTTYIVASLNGYSDTSIVSVENAAGMVGLDSFEGLAAGPLTG